jgi:hypothetical protein
LTPTKLDEEERVAHEAVDDFSRRHKRDRDPVREMSKQFSDMECDFAPLLLYRSEFGLLQFNDRAGTDVLERG